MGVARAVRTCAVVYLVGVLFFVLLNQSFGSMFMILNTFVKERDVMQRERASGMYGVLPYYLSKNLAELPMSLVPIVFGAVTYFIINLRNTPEAFFTFILGIYLVTFTTESLAFTLAAVSPSVEVATGIAPLILIFFVIFGGTLHEQSARVTRLHSHCEPRHQPTTTAAARR